MQIELYKLDRYPSNFDLAARLEEIEASPLEKRNRHHQGDHIRLEAFERRGDLWLCDFVRIRMEHGPSKAGVGAPAVGFDLNVDEGFGEETAFLWDAERNWCVVQYNHHGVRVSTISEYLAHYNHDIMQHLVLSPKIDDDIQAKLRRKKIVSKVRLSVAPKKLGNEDFDAGAALGSGIKSLKSTQAEKVQIVISTRKRSGLDLGLEAFAEWIGRFASGGKGGPLNAALVSAKEKENEKAEVLDLLRHRVTTEEIVKAGVDRRFSRKDRFDAVHRAHTRWLPLMI